LRAKLDDTEVVVVIATGPAADYLAGLGVDAVVIRPDRYILGVASTPAELDAVLSRRPPRPPSPDVSRSLRQAAAS
jgi:hypothetical protein